MHNLLFYILLAACAFSSSISAQSASRLVSLTLSVDEILWHTMTPATRKNQIISLSPLARDPRYSNIASKKDLPILDLGTDLERLVFVKPDLVFLSAYNRPEYVRILNQFKIRFERLPDVTTLPVLYDTILHVTKAVGVATDGQALVGSLKARLAKLVAPKKAKTVLTYSTGNILGGSQTLFDEILRHAHTVNLAATSGISGWQKMSQEVLAKQDPDVVILPVDHKGKPEMTLDALRKEAGWRSIPAIKEGRVITIPQVLLAAASQYSVDAVEAIYTSLYKSAQ